MICVLNYYSTHKFAMKNEWWLFTLIFHNVHEQGISRSSSIIPLNGQPSTCFIGIIHVYLIWIFYLRCIIYSYKLATLIAWFHPSRFFYCPGPWYDLGWRCPRAPFHCVPPCLLFILDRQRRLTVIHKYIVPHTPLFHCTVHNFGCLTCVSPQWNHLQCEHVMTPWHHH